MTYKPVVQKEPPLGGRKKVTVMSAIAAAGLAATLATKSELRKHYPYYDVAGVLTVCEGLTGDWIVKGKYYSDAECSKRTTEYIQKMSAKMGKCVGPLTDESWKVWGHFTYNVGTPSFCNSTAAKLLKQGKYNEACDQMLRWDVLTIKGKKYHCSLPANRSGKNRINGCDGIMNRREMEHAQCKAAAKFEYTAK